MGASEFQNTQSASTAEEAFQAPVEQARYEDGNGGYTGTIAEKSGFRMEQPRKGEAPRACVSRCTDDPHHWSNDKFEDAACVDGGPDPKQPDRHIFYFFGLASS